MSRPWMPLYVADYLADTGHLSAAEHGAYLLLIMHYWANEGLPTDDRQLARVARLSDREWRASRATLAAFFAEGWVHARIDAELADAQGAYERRAGAGRKGGRAHRRPKQCLSNATAGPAALLEQSPSQPSSDGSSSVPSEEPVASRSPATKLRLAVVKAYTDAGRGIPPDTGRVHVWLTQGYRADLIIAVLLERFARGQHDKPLSYFDGPIADAHRVAAPVASEIATLAAPMEFVPEHTDDWHAWCAYRLARGERKPVATTLKGRREPGSMFPTKRPPSFQEAAE